MPGFDASRGTAAIAAARGTLIRRPLIACWTASCIVLAAIGCPTAAQAQFQVCNQTFDVVNLAIAQEVGATVQSQGTYQSEGWWTIGANRCVDVVKAELVNRYLYVFATDVFDQPILDGTVEMCIGPKRFVIVGTESCWQRGHRVGRFMEVDTQAVQRWTLFLRDPYSN